MSVLKAMATAARIRRENVQPLEAKARRLGLIDYLDIAWGEIVWRDRYSGNQASLMARKGFPHLIEAPFWFLQTIVESGRHMHPFCHIMKGFVFSDADDAEFVRMLHARTYGVVALNPNLDARRYNDLLVRAYEAL